MKKNAIIFVDDELIVLQTLRAQAKKSFGDKYVYECAQSADEAWEVIDELAEGGIDILILVSDWLMPGIKGDEFLAAVHQKYPHIVTVMLTGQADAASIEHARRDANLFRCILKPWNEQELIECITSGLEDKYE